MTSQEDPPPKHVVNIVNDDARFDDLIESIGSYGKFQSRFDLIYNLLYSIILTAPYLNIILSVSVPEHWCHVPGMEDSNLTLKEWKELTLPKEIDPQTKQEAFSSCKMFSANSSIINCQHGFDYDRQWWKETTASYQNWVCDRDLYVTNSFVAGRIGEIIGTIVFGILGDTMGRRPVFYISIAVLLLGRTASVFTSQWYYVFLATILIGSSATTAIYQSPIVISMEISSSEKRSNVAFLSCVGWVAGLCFLDLIAWLSRDWQVVMLATTLPVVIPFLTYKLLPESPRWLAARGNIKEAVKTLEHISQVNGTNLPENTQQVIQNIANKKEKFFGFASLFSSLRLARNTTILVFCWVITSLAYYILMLNVTNMAGDPFLNFFWQSIAEFPGYLAGRILSDRVGRRWTHTGAYLTAVVLCFTLTLLNSESSPVLATFLVSLVKICITCSFYMVWLQAMEIYPTCVRQSGSSLGGTMANIGGILGPYVVYFGTSDDSRYPYIVLCMTTLLGATLSSFLPETLGRKLPETLEEAHVFGEEQEYFSCRPKQKSKQ